MGEGPERRRLEGELPGADFTGLLTGRDLGRAMASLDLFVHTGEHETFCQTIQGAMAERGPGGRPAAGGPIDLVADGLTGRLYRPGDVAHLEAIVEGLVRSPARRRDLAAAGYAAVRGRTWTSVGDQLVAHYRRVIGDRAGGRAVGVGRGRPGAGRRPAARSARRAA